MSFSGEVKEELSKHISPARHCQIAELAAFMHFCGQYGRDENGNYLPDEMRLTKLGKFLRATSLDELPELNPVQLEEYKQQAEAEVQLQLEV